MSSADFCRYFFRMIKILIVFNWKKTILICVILTIDIVLIFFIYFRLFNIDAYGRSTFNLGICISDTCPADYIQKIFNKIFNKNENETIITIPEKLCSSSTPQQWTTGDWICAYEKNPTEFSHPYYIPNSTNNDIISPKGFRRYYLFVEMGNSRARSLLRQINGIRHASDWIRKSESIRLCHPIVYLRRWFNDSVCVCSAKIYNCICVVDKSVRRLLSNRFPDWRFRH